VRLVRDKGGRADDHESSIVRKQGTLSIELFVAVGDGDSELQFEEPGEHTVTDPVVGWGLLVVQVFALNVLEEVGGSSWPLVPVHLQRGLIRTEGNELFPVWAELPEEARRLLHVDEGEAGEDVGVEATVRVDLSPLVPGSEQLSVVEPHCDVLRRDHPGPKCVVTVVHLRRGFVFVLGDSPALFAPEVPLLLLLFLPEEKPGGGGAWPRVCPPSRSPGPRG